MSAGARPSTSPSRARRSSFDRLRTSGESKRSTRPMAGQVHVRAECVCRPRFAIALPPYRELVLRTALAEEVAAVLGLPSPHGVAPDRAISELGADSLMAVEIRNRIGALSRLDLPATLVFDHPTVAALARHVLERWAL